MQEVHALASLEDVSEDEIYQLGGMSRRSHTTTSSTRSKQAAPTATRDRRFHSLVRHTCTAMVPPLFNDNTIRPVQQFLTI